MIKWLKNIFMKDENKPPVSYAPELEWKGEGTYQGIHYHGYLIKEAKLDLVDDYVGMLVIYFNENRDVIHVKTHFFSSKDEIYVNDLISRVHKLHHG